MKKNLAKKITLSILAGAVLMSSGVVWARDIEDKVTLSGGDPWKQTTIIINGSYLYAPKNEIDDTFSSSGNNVTFTDNIIGAVSGYFAGGYTETGDVVENKIDINGGIFPNRIYGGYAKDGNAKNNEISVGGGILTGGSSLYGGYTETGDVVENKVDIIGGTIINNYNVYGGYAETGNANANVINVSGGSFGAGIKLYGGYAKEGNDKEGVAKTGNAETGNANANVINVSRGSFENGTNLYGGYAETGNANENVITITGGSFNGNTGLYGGYAETGNANGNRITITGGSFSGEINGGFVKNHDGNANGNRITITGGSFSGQISGGYIYEGTGSAEENIINIAGNANLSGAMLFGGRGGTSRSGDLCTGNKLNIGDGDLGWKGEVKSISNFAEINFYNLKWEADNAAIKITGDAPLGIGSNGLEVNIKNISKESRPKKNQVMTLIESPGVIDKAKIKDIEKNKVVKIGNFLEAEGYIDVSQGDINFTITKAGANEQVLVIGESRAAATAFTNQGSEIIETGLDALARDNDKDTKVFAALYGNASEFATGSHVKVNGWSGMVGVGKTNADGLTVGAFFENGEGNYRTYNTVDGEFMRGDGEACYNGGGFLVRKDNADGVYTEASLRAGNLQNELRNAVLAGDKLAGYDIDTFYYGAHVGIGKVIPRGNDGDSIDVYGKFIYTHHDSEDFKIDGDEFHFDSVDSERLRLGFRINEVQNNKLNMYYGAAWEYEFGGDADNTVVGYDLSTPSLGGSTVIGEIGAHYKASDKWSIDLNGRAYVGQREGFSGSVQANYAF